ncbi:hypothetical protein CDAR_442991 [Caerostris darwini]|uniref:Uncharacterized protein n=1 Tax=Caerostris darwini TaxID=1538125 RepID=A0AAV4VQC6_9ARAC|nr:hypothetical protein CDAR_442991 [Caerostris darwini]
MSLWTSCNTISHYPSVNSPYGVGMSTKGKRRNRSGLFAFQMDCSIYSEKFPGSGFPERFSPKWELQKAPPMSHIMLLMGRDLCGGGKNPG